MAQNEDKKLPTLENIFKNTEDILKLIKSKSDAIDDLVGPMEEVNLNPTFTPNKGGKQKLKDEDKIAALQILNELNDENKEVIKGLYTILITLKIEFNKKSTKVHDDRLNTILLEFISIIIKVNENEDLYEVLKQTIPKMRI